MDGRRERRSGSIVLLSEAREEALAGTSARGDCASCRTLNAKTNEVAIETLEICYEGLELQ
jgi:hypothetical protein